MLNEDGEPVHSSIDSAMERAKSDLKKVQQDIYLHKILLGRSIKSLEERKSRVESYCEKKKEEADDLMRKAIDIHSQKFLNQCTSFSKALLEFLGNR